MISLCIPVMNRTYDLKQTLPKTILAANASPPVEIVVCNYDSKDDLDDYMSDVVALTQLAEGNLMTYIKSPHHVYFSISHSRNIAARASRGDYILILDADIIPRLDFVCAIRKLIEQENPTWMVEGNRMGRMPVVKREEFMMMGGYDERFIVCGPEDKEICTRLQRRGGKFVQFPASLVDEIPTPYREKFKNVDQRPYLGQGQIKREMSRAMRKFYEENNVNQVMVVNEGVEWGQI